MSRKSNFYYFFILILVGACLSSARAGELIIKDREPMVLCCDNTGRVEFKMRFNPFVCEVRKLSRMKRKVEKLFKSKMMEFGGDTLELDGYPTWAPYSSYGPDGCEIHLMFAEKFTVDHDSKTIIIVGSKEKPSSYFPYDLPGY